MRPRAPPLSVPSGNIKAPLSGPSENPAPAGAWPLTSPRPPASADLVGEADGGAAAQRPGAGVGPRRAHAALLGAVRSPPDAGLVVDRRGADRRAATPAPVSSWDWPSYGHDAQHTFHGRTTLTEPRSGHASGVVLPTGDAVTATPTVVDGTVYVGRGTISSMP